MWEDDRNGSEDIYLNRSHDSGKTTNAVVHYLYKPEMAVNEDFSRVYVVWQQDFMTYFRAGTPMLFGDGFELGVTWQWSEAVD